MNAVLNVKFEDTFVNQETGSMLVKPQPSVFGDNMINKNTIVKSGMHYYQATNKFEEVKIGPGDKKKFRIIKSIK